jgi:hypothetical protein
MVLERVEGRPALFIERHDLAVEDRLVRHWSQRLHVTWISRFEILVIA